VLQTVPHVGVLFLIRAGVAQSHLESYSQKLTTPATRVVTLTGMHPMVRAVMMVIQWLETAAVPPVK
jgi:hypothetical protein